MNWGRYCHEGIKCDLPGMAVSLTGDKMCIETTTDFRSQVCMCVEKGSETLRCGSVISKKRK